MHPHRALLGKYASSDGASPGYALTTQDDVSIGNLSGCSLPAPTSLASGRHQPSTTHAAAMSTPALLAAVANNASAAAHASQASQTSGDRAQPSEASVAFGSPVVAEGDILTGGETTQAEDMEGEMTQDMVEAVKEEESYPACDDDSTIDLYQQIIRRRSSPKPQRVLLGGQVPKQPSPQAPKQPSPATPARGPAEVVFLRNRECVRGYGGAISVAVRVFLHVQTLYIQL